MAIGWQIIIAPQIVFNMPIFYYIVHVNWNTVRSKIGNYYNNHGDQYCKKSFDKK